MIKQLTRVLVASLFTVSAVTATAQNGELNLNGIASFEQLRKEYYIGALYLGWPGHDPAAIANMPGKKRMDFHITADRWPALRFSQVWNQLITINNPSATINANAMDIVAFTSIPRGDLVEGDQLVVELTSNNTTLVSLNGAPALRTDSPALFSMLLNTWIGQRPPSSEFKRDVLEAPKDKAGTDLLARFNATHPADARKKAVLAWGLKPEPEAVATTAPVAATRIPSAPAPTPVAAAPGKKAEPVAVKPDAERAPAPVAATPVQAAAPVVAAAPAQPAATPDVQKILRNEYISQIRKLVVRNIDYPKRAIKDSIEGLVMVKVKVDRSGELIDFQIVQPADDLLDAAAERAARKAGPFPKPSDELEGSAFESLIPIVFKLTQ